MNIKYKSTLDKFKKYLNLKGYSKNSINIYIHYVYEFINSFDKSAIHLTIQDCKYYIENYNFTSISKQNQIYSSIKAYYKFILGINLSGKIFLERPRKEKHLPKIIDDTYILTCLNKIKNIKHKAVLSLAYSVGLRISELINLKIENIDSKRMIITIKQAKGNKDRIVPLSKYILSLLRIYYKNYKPVNFLFNGQSSEKYSSTSINNIVKKYLGKEYHIHLLRHSCFTNLLESGTDIRIIQKIAGHSSSKTTEIYTHVSNNLLLNVKLPI